MARHTPPLPLCLAITVLVIAFHGVRATALRSGASSPSLGVWLGSLVFHVPDFVLNTSILGAEADVSATAVRVTGVGLASILSDVEDSENLALSAAGLTANISFHMVSTYLGSHVEADVETSLTDGGLDITAGLTELNGLPLSVVSKRCSAFLVVGKLSFYGGTAAHILEELAPVIRSAIEKIVPTAVCDGVILPLFNQTISPLISQISGTLRPFVSPEFPVPPEAPEGSRTMSSNAPVDAIRWLVSDMIGAKGFGWVVSRLTRGLCSLNTSSLTLPSLSFEVNTFGVDATITAALEGAELSGLCSWTEMVLFDSDPRDQYTLDANFGLKTLGTSVNISFNVSTPGTEPLIERANLQLQANSTKIFASIRSLVDTAISRSLNHNQLANLQCVLSMLKNVSLFYVNANTTLELLHVGLQDGGDLEKNIANLIYNVAGLTLDQFPAIVPAITNLMSAELIEGKVNSLTSRLCGGKCFKSDLGRSIGFREDTSTGAFASVGGIIVVTASFAAVVAAMRKSVNFKILSESSAILPEKRPQDKFYSIWANNLYYFFTGGEDKRRACVLFDSRLSWLARLGVPLIVIGDIALFISSTSSVVIAIVLKLEWQSAGAPRHVIETSPLFEYNLIDAMVDMWNSGVYPLAILIGAFSGIWPYIKLLMMLVCWSAPGQVLSTEKRGKTLSILDILGKWSLVDMYVMCTMMVMFHIVINFGMHNFTAVIDPVTIRVVVVPCWGMTAFLAATVISLAISDVALYYHKKLEKMDQLESECSLVKSNARDDTQLAPFITELFSTKSGPKRFAYRLAVLLLAVFTSAFTFGAILIDSISFDYRGAAGVFLDKVLDYNVRRDFSLGGIITDVPFSTPSPNSFDPRSVQGTLTLTSFVLPLLSSMGLVLLLVVPMSKRIRETTHEYLHLMGSWSCIDVFVVAVTVAVLEAQQFSDFVVQDVCDAVNHVLDEYFDEDLDGSNTCIAMSARLLPGAWVMFTAAALQFACFAIIHRTRRQATAYSKRIQS